MVSKFEGPGDRERLAALGDVDAREREAVAAAKQRREEADEALTNGAILVTEEDLDAIVDEGSVVVFTGTDNNDRIVTFAVDHCPAQDIVALVREHGELACAVEDWQVLARR